MAQQGHSSSWIFLLALAALLLLGGQYWFLPHSGPDNQPPFSWHYNINDATSEQLLSLPGLGPSRAAAILELQQEKCLQSVDDLQQIKGIGPKTIEKWRPYLFAGPCRAEDSAAD